ncbi:YoaK family protein [Vibrio sinaloensis]|uniref:Membrane protein n=1 Tax=Photobacterium sp. (strain ATCC 43367) TaxID=379097 RepID=A0A0A5I0S5_PHOS4|nr:YoaK family protein [Vibrio sinaloensis]KGY10125.1 membrane protein [Vibrio sinaloensis]KHT46962.1 membrane protein [Vibrio sinaloensis]KHT47842.1 membrane protein [Vibrio sinaloensis]KIE21826.1 membrane protein [Vibrio sinaloensis]
MISKLPKWVEYGAFLLALLAGVVNAIGLLGFQHQAVSHISGTVTLLGTSIEAFDSQTFHLFMVLFSFLLGATLSGLFIESTALKLGRRYGVALCIESALLLIAYWMLKEGHISGQYFASAACGLQNAMITTFSGAVVRTTHMTGIITDLGIMIGARLRGEYFDYRKAKLFLFIFSGFLSGGIVGAKLFSVYAISALLAPIAFALLLAFSYWGYLWLKRTQEDRNHK